MMNPKATRRLGSADSSQTLYRNTKADDHVADKSVKNPAPDSSPPAAPNGTYWEEKITHA